MSRILIDFGALKSGGGCQLALNFIDCLSKMKNVQTDKYIFLLPPVGPLRDLDAKYPMFSYLHSPSDNPIKRVLFETFELKKYYKDRGIKKIFTFFGTGLPHPPQIISVVGVAYPIICYEESPFWSYLSAYDRIRIKIKNRFRVRRLASANFILVETEIMKKRVSQVVKNKRIQYDFLRPSPSSFVLENKHLLVEAGAPKFLFLSGVAPHKNLWRLPELAFELKKYLADFNFIISVKEEDFIGHLKSEKSRQLFNDFRAHFDFRGTIYPSEINEVYQNTDFLVSLSDLESYSNNYMEAWKAGVPLIVSDRDFARNICRKSAIYIEPHNPSASAELIFNHLQDLNNINKKTEEGKKYLPELPTTIQRTERILHFMDNVTI